MTFSYPLPSPRHLESFPRIYNRNVLPPPREPVKPTPLYAAVCRQHAEAIGALTTAGCHVNKCADGGGTPLHIAAFIGMCEVVGFLTKAGCDVDNAAEEGETPLLAAAGKGLAEVVGSLLMAVFNMDKAMDDGDTPLHTAAVTGHTEVVAALLNAGCDKDKAADDDVTPLYAAAMKGHTGVVEVLLNAGCDTSSVGLIRGPQMVGAVVGHLEEQRTKMLALAGGMHRAQGRWCCGWMIICSGWLQKDWEEMERWCGAAGGAGRVRRGGGRDLRPSGHFSAAEESSRRHPRAPTPENYKPPPNPNICCEPPKHSSRTRLIVCGGSPGSAS